MNQELVIHCNPSILPEDQNDNVVIYQFSEMEFGVLGGGLIYSILLVVFWDLLVSGLFWSSPLWVVQGVLLYETHFC